MTSALKNIVHYSQYKFTTFRSTAKAFLVNTTRNNGTFSSKQIYLMFNDYDQHSLFIQGAKIILRAWENETFLKNYDNLVKILKFMMNAFYIELCPHGFYDAIIYGQVVLRAYCLMSKNFTLNSAQQWVEKCRMNLNAFHEKRKSLKRINHFHLSV